MNGRKYEDLKDWEKEFYDLNMKIGNDAWGARLEPNGAGGTRLRVFINKEEMEEMVLQETGGYIAGHPVVFSLYHEDDYIRHQKEELVKEEKKEQEAILNERSTTPTT